MMREEKYNNSELFGGNEIQDGHHIRAMIVHHPLLEDLRENVSIFAFEHMLFQFS